MVYGMFSHKLRYNFEITVFRNLHNADKFIFVRTFSTQLLIVSLNDRLVAITLNRRLPLFNTTYQACNTFIKPSRK